MTRYLASLFFLALAVTGHTAETDLVLDTAERYVRQQTLGLPGKVQVKMGTLDVTRLPPCTAHEAFSPSGTRLSGKTHVGVRCLGPAIWSVLVPVHIAITGNYLRVCESFVRRTD